MSDKSPESRGLLEEAIIFMKIKNIDRGTFTKSMHGYTAELNIYPDVSEEEDTYVDEE